MQIIFKQLSILYIFLLAGWLIGKLKKDKAPHADILSVLLVNILLPCKVFNTFSKNFTVSYISEKYVLIITSLIMLAVMTVCGVLIAGLLTKKKYEKKVYAYSFIIGNYGYLGYALIEYVFGQKVLTDFMLFVIPFVIFTYTAGYMMLTGSGFSFKRLVTPSTVSIVLGIAAGLSGIYIPEVIATVTANASACVGPLSMLLTGITLSTFMAKDLLSNKTAYAVSFIRLIALPAVAFLICKVAGLDTLLPMILMVACMPCGLNTVVFPKIVGEDCTTGARLALITHTLSIVTLPLWLSLI